MSKIVAITGEGIISAIGNDKNTVWESLRKGQSGIGEMRFLQSVHHELPVGEVSISNDEMESQLGVVDDKYLSRTTLMGIMAVKQALADANLFHAIINKRHLRIVLISGTTVGGMDVTENYYKDLRSNEEHLECLKYHDAGSSTKSIKDYFEIFSDYITVSTACSSAANAIILGADMIKAGEADIVVAGGSESLSRFHLNGFNSLMILDKERCRPFDATRAGLNLGEGAAFVVMESEELALFRNVSIHAYLTGYCNACDAFHQTASSEKGEGAYRAMMGALSMAGLSPSDIQYINAHGTGTLNNDVSESVALKRVFSEKMPLVSSTKSFTGHTTSAAGGIEAVISILALQKHFIPGNLGWKNQLPDGITPTLGIADYDVKTVMSNSFGFGGNDSSLIFSLTRPSKTDDTFFCHTDDEIKELSRIEITDERELREIIKYVKPLESRRMGKLMKSTLLSSLKALEMANIAVPDAIIMGTAWGCLENSEKLLDQLEDEGEVLLKPTYFMQSTHNTLSSSVAIRTHCHGYNITYTQGRDSLKWAVKDAKRQLKSGKCKTVLVCCNDETTPTFSSLMAKIGEINLLPIHSIAFVLSCGK